MASTIDELMAEIESTRGSQALTDSIGFLDEDPGLPFDEPLPPMPVDKRASSPTPRTVSKKASPPLPPVDDPPPEDETPPPPPPVAKASKERPTDHAARLRSIVNEFDQMKVHNISPLAPAGRATYRVSSAEDEDRAAELWHGVTLLMRNIDENSLPEDVKDSLQRMEAAAERSALAHSYHGRTATDPGSGPVFRTGKAETIHAHRDHLQTLAEGRMDSERGDVDYGMVPRAVGRGLEMVADEVVDFAKIPFVRSYISEESSKAPSIGAAEAYRDDQRTRIVAGQAPLGYDDWATLQFSGDSLLVDAFLP